MKLNSQEESRLREIDNKLKLVKSNYQAIFAVWYSVDLKRVRMENEIKSLEKERDILLQGQLVFDESQEF